MKRFVLVLALIPSYALAQPQSVAIVGAAILTGTGDTIENGVLVFKDGKIVSVGAADGAPPAEASIIEGEGLYLTPGLIDAHSQYGIQGSSWDPANLAVPGRDVLEPFKPEEKPLWLRSGVTTTFISPGGQNLLGGYGAVVKLTGALVRERAALVASFGETALDAFEAPTTRQGMIAILRQTFIRGREDALVDEGGKAIGLALSKEIPLHVIANTPDDILTALRFSREFDLRLVLVSAMGGHQVASQIAAASVPVIVGPSIIGIGDGGPFEGFPHTPANAARLAEAGVSIALSTFARRGRSVALEGVMAKAHGLPPESALRAVTSDAAAILGVE
ncbi:MAG: hypothetical protein ACRD3V_20360, partial [Vicinamibacteria bacterium]